MWCMVCTGQTYARENVSIAGGWWSHYLRFIVTTQALYGPWLSLSLCVFQFVAQGVLEEKTMDTSSWQKKGKKTKLNSHIQCTDVFANTQTADAHFALGRTIEFNWRLRTQHSTSLVSRHRQQVLPSCGILWFDFVANAEKCQNGKRNSPFSVATCDNCVCLCAYIFPMAFGDGDTTPRHFGLDFIIGSSQTKWKTKIRRRCCERMGTMESTLHINLNVTLWYRRGLLAFICTDRQTLLRPNAIWFVYCVRGSRRQFNFKCRILNRHRCDAIRPYNLLHPPQKNTQPEMTLFSSLHLLLLSFYYFICIKRWTNIKSQRENHRWYFNWVISVGSTVWVLHFMSPATAECNAAQLMLLLRKELHIPHSSGPIHSLSLQLVVYAVLCVCVQGTETMVQLH